MAEITYRLDKAIDIEAWRLLYNSIGWNRGWTIRNAETMPAPRTPDHYRPARRSDCWDLTVLSDGPNYATIDDVVVHPTHQGHGIGSQLVRLAIEQVGHLQPHLEAIPALRSSTRGLGFVVHQGHTAMVWLDRQAPA